MSSLAGTVNGWECKRWERSQPFETSAYSQNQVNQDWYEWLTGLDLIPIFRSSSRLLSPDDDAPPVKQGRPTKPDSLTRRLAKKAGVRAEMILHTDRIQYVDEEDKDKDSNNEDDKDEG